MKLVNKLLIFALVLVFTTSFASAIGCDNDGICDAGENLLWCSNDCHPAAFCGDGFCDANEQGNCPADCGASCTPTNGGVEKCDGADNDCDGTIDEGVKTTYYKDIDNDSYSDGVTLIQCTKPANYKLASELTSIAGDCNDTNAVLNPATVWYKDADNDSYSDGTTLIQCPRPAGYKLSSELTAIAGDCNDTNAVLNPATVWYKDVDNDGYSDGVSSVQCARPTNYKLASELIATSGDCNDTNSVLNPTTIWYKDADNDLYSDGTNLTQCIQPANYELASELTAITGDCNDTNSILNPTTTWYKDGDNDSYSDGSTLTQCTRPVNYKLSSELTATSGDCNDSDLVINPTTVWYKDADNDLYSDGINLTQCTKPANYKLASELIAITGDCNDSNAVLNPLTIWYNDSDGDGYGNPSSTTQSCTAPIGHVNNSIDCNDANSTINPGAAEVCNGLDENCNGLIDDGLPIICGWTPVSGTLSIPGTASQSFNLLISNPYSDLIDINWYDGSTQVQAGGFNYSFIANPGLVGMHTIKVVANNTITGNSSLKEWNLNVTPADWVTFWGRVTDSETGMPAPGKKLSFYLDTEIESKYSNVEELESYTYSTWQALVPKEIPDYRTNADGYFFTDLANGTYNYVIQGSREDEMEVKVSGSGSNKNSTVSMTKMIMPRTGYVKFYFESASAGLKSDLYLGSPNNILLVPNSTAGMSYVTNNTYANGTELKLYILVHGKPMGLGEYKHWSNDSVYAKVEQLDSDTWRVFFEDLPANQADFDFNDVVALVDLIDIPNATIPTNDCDSDGIPNWQDLNDSWCDTGDNQSVRVNFNADGHILYSGGNYVNSNNYTCGQSLRFLIFGNNSGSANETITFAIQDHTSNGNPNASMIYIGNLSNSADILTVTPNSSAEKRFDWGIPCSPMPANGHYDIHISHNGDNLWRKIGDFYIIPDTTPPQLNVFGPYYTFRNQPISAGYWSGDFPQPGSMPDLIFTIQSISNVPDTSIQIKVNKDVINNPGAIDATGYGGNQEINLTYNESGYFTTRLTATDPSGNEAYRDINVTVWITEEDADALAYPIYDIFLGPWGAMPGGMNDYTTNYRLQSWPVVINASWDHYNTVLNIGDEYLTAGDNLTSEEAYSYTDYYAKLDWDNVVNGCHGPGYIKPISPSTAEEYNQTLYNYLLHLNNSVADGYSIPCGNAI